MIPKGFRAVIWGAMAALAIALLDMPYGYYQLLRVGICLAAGFAAYFSSQSGGAAWTGLFVAIAVVYNPIAKLALGRELWGIVNVATIVAFASLLMSPTLRQDSREVDRS